MKRLLLGAVAALGTHLAQGQAPAVLEAATNPAYRLVFEDEFEYGSTDEMENATNSLIKLPDNSYPKKWEVANFFVWKSTAYTDVSESYCHTRNDVGFVRDPALNKKCLALRFTYHPAPLSNHADTPPEQRLPPPETQPTTPYTIQPVFYRTSGRVRALFPNSADNSLGQSCGNTFGAGNGTGFRYGIFEISAKMPSHDGQQAAFWLFNGAGTCGTANCDRDPQSLHNWEIDVFETFMNGGSRAFFSTVQPNPYSVVQGVSTYYSFSTDLSAAFHTYAVAWTPTRLTWFFDGKEVRTADNANGVPYSPLDLILSAHYLWDCGQDNGNDITYNNNPYTPLASRTAPSGCPSTSEPYLIDYVKVWKPANNDAILWPKYKNHRSWFPSTLVTAAQTNLGLPTQSVLAISGQRPNTKLFFTDPPTHALKYAQFSSTNNQWQVVPAVSNLQSGTPLAVEPATGNVFFVGTDRSIWRYQPGVSPAVMLGTPPTDGLASTEALAFGQVPVAEGLGLTHQDGRYEPALRVFYINDTHEVWYYEYLPTTGQWKIHRTYVSNANGALHTVAGAAFYRGADNEVWLLTRQGGPGSWWWSAQSLNPNGAYYAAGDVGEVLGVVDSRAVTTGMQIFYKSGATGALKYYEYTIYDEDLTACNSYGFGGKYPKKSDPLCANCAPPLNGTHPNWKLFTAPVSIHLTSNTGVRVLKPFNNQLYYLTPTYKVRHYRHFKRFKYNRLAFEPSQPWYTEADTTSVTSSVSTSEVLLNIFGVDDNLVYALAENGRIVQFYSTEILNPAPSWPNQSVFVARPASTLLPSQPAAPETLALYPNPAHDEVTLSDDVTAVQVLNTQGKAMTGFPFQRGKLNVGAAPAGLYLLRLTLRNGSVTSRQLQVVH